MGTHGVTVQQLTDGAKPIGVVSPSVIGMVAPVSDAATGVVAGDVKVIRGAKSISDLGLDATDDADLILHLTGIYAQGQAVVVLVAVDEGADDTERATNCAAGVPTLETAKSETGYKPKILIAPKYSAEAAVSSALLTTAGKLLAVALIDSDNGTEAAAIAEAGVISDPDGRAYFVDPWVTVDGSDVAPSPFVAGLIVAVDTKEGWHRSPSNHVLLGIDGTSRVVGFELGDATCEAQNLNDAKIATIVREQGWRLWGNKTLSADSDYAFLARRRAADVIAESIKLAHLWVVDQGITKRLGETVVDSVNGFLRKEKALGHIINGSAWLDPELNTPTTLAAGEFWIDYDFTDVPTGESINFRQHLTNAYLTEVI